MKKTTERIIEKFPFLAGEIEKFKEQSLEAKDLSSLSDVEKTFLELACFFENPERAGFDLQALYKRLDNDWLELAIELIGQFFKEDTYLIPNSTLFFVNEKDEYLNQSQFAEYLSSKGLNYNRAKLNIYYKRGIIPKADIILSEKPHWKRSTVESYCELEKEK